MLARVRIFRLSENEARAFCFPSPGSDGANKIRCKTVSPRQVKVFHNGLLKNPAPRRHGKKEITLDRASQHNQGLFLFTLDI